MNDAPEGTDLTVVDLLLGEGTPSAQHELRSRIDGDPLLALEVAETVAVLERFRELRVDASQRGAARLADVVRRAERRVGPPRVAAWRCLLAAGVAAVATFTLLWSLTPSEPRPAPATALAAAQRALVAEPTSARPPKSADAAADPFEEVRRRLEHESPRLREALAAASAPQSDPMARWLDPHNSVALMRLDHELRRSADERERRQRMQGGMPGSEERLQELASAVALQLPAELAGLSLAEQLEAPSATSGMLRDVALAVRSLLAAGLGDDLRERAVAVGSDWLVRRLDRCHGEVLVLGLLPLLELAAMRGDHAEVVREQGQRLVDEVVATDEAWRRHRPQLLGPSVACEVLGEAGRLLRLLPAFGVSDRSCRVVRHLLLAELHDRRERGADGPEVLAATLFGFADLVPEGERAAIERQLRRWKPSLLAPDFDTLVQMAWGMEPGRVGVSSWRRGLRMLAVRQDPRQLGARAGLCLSLASCYGAPAEPVH